MINKATFNAIAPTPPLDRQKYGTEQGWENCEKDFIEKYGEDIWAKMTTTTTTTTTTTMIANYESQASNHLAKAEINAMANNAHQAIEDRYQKSLKELNLG